MNLKWITLQYSRENPVTPEDFKTFRGFKPVLVDVSTNPFKFINCYSGLGYTNKESSNNQCKTLNYLLENYENQKLTLEQILKEFEIN